MDFLNKFGSDLASSSTPKSSIYYSKEKEIEDEKKNLETDIDLKNRELYYQRQLRESLANNKNKVVITPVSKYQHNKPSCVPIINPVDVNTSQKPMTIKDFINKFNNEQKSSNSTVCSASTPVNTTCTQSNGNVLCTTTVTPSSNSSQSTMSCTSTNTNQPSTSVCTTVPSGGTICTTEQNLDNMSINDLITGVNKDIMSLQKESDELMTDVTDAKEYTTKMINQIMKLVKGLEQFQKK
ncbi:39kDa virion core protein [Yokapox virus]|uniref:39kDa core protein OPG130 n=1 Tax=Yokapox virus TaxID=1076255 RepID=G3EHZ7_9POXV|nr:39kDa virion core protein [Yokapox virus]AEN03694.1 39kDa virion core protein [Yokapox virus]